MTDYIKNTLFSLANADCAGNVTEAAELAEAELKKYTETEKVGKNIIGYMGKGDYTLMLAAHIDEVSFIVTDVDKNGFVTVAACGGIDLRHLPSRRVVIHGKEDIKGVFCSVPPHLKKSDKAFDDISNFKIDTLLGEKAGDVISAGDTVTYFENAVSLSGNRVTGKAIDNRAGVTAILETARRLSGKELPFKVAFCLTNEEELGLRGAQTAAFYLSPSEAVAIDVTFGDSPDISREKTCKMGGGAMIGIAPILNRDMSDRFEKIAKEKQILFGKEIMSPRTGTDGDVISISGEGVKTGLISIPIRNMHTPCEVVDLSDIAAVCDILEEYVLSGGIKNV